jgi:hypothetical protein
MSGKCLPYLPKSRKVAKTCIIVAYLGFLETLIYPVWERDGEPGGRDRSVPPSGQPAGKVEASVRVHPIVIPSFSA